MAGTVSRSRFSSAFFFFFGSAQGSVFGIQDALPGPWAHRGPRGLGP